MNYIIEPSWFYWVEVFECIKYLGVISAIVLATVGGVVITCEWYWNKDKYKIIIILIMTVIFLGIGIFVPSKTTMFQMMGAKLSTTDNVELVKENGKELVEFMTNEIIEIINETKK